MITSSASAIASNKVTTVRRAASPMRVRASENSSANTTSGSTSPFAAAAMTFEGITPLKKSATPGSGPVGFCSMPASAPRNPSAVACGRGKACVSSNMTMAPKIAEMVHTITIHTTERAAIFPARAASALFATPVTSKVTTSGITVILRPFNHKEPMNDATPSAAAWLPAGQASANRPSSSPAMSAASAQYALKLLAALSVEAAAVVSLNAASGT